MITYVDTHLPTSTQSYSTGALNVNTRASVPHPAGPPPVRMTALRHRSVDRHLVADRLAFVAQSNFRHKSTMCCRWRADGVGAPLNELVGPPTRYRPSAKRQFVASLRAVRRGGRRNVLFRSPDGRGAMSSLSGFARWSNSSVANICCFIWCFPTRRRGVVALAGDGGSSVWRPTPRRWEMMHKRTNYCTIEYNVFFMAHHWSKGISHRYGRSLNKPGFVKH
jgi:hypothetical protein